MRLNWRPIKSAPKDGTMILLAEWPGDGDAVVWWGRWVDVPQENTRGPRIANRKHDPMWVASYAAIYTSGSADDATWHLKPIIVFEPTHWMPTPQPPARRPRR